MTDEFKIPTVPEKLKKKDLGSYVLNLERGLAGVEELLQRETHDAHALLKRAYLDLVEEAKKIEGVTIRELPQIRNELREGDKVLITSSVNGTVIEYEISKAKGIERAIDDISTRTKRAYEDALRPYQDRITALGKAQEDFKEAITDLTEITPLNEGTREPNSAHFYLVRNDGVYETHVDLKEDKVLEPYKNQHLTAETFRDGRTLDAFRIESQELAVNAYLITNPSSVIPVGVVFLKGTEIALGQIYKTEGEDETPGGLLGSLKRAVSFFRRG